MGMEYPWHVTLTITSSDRNFLPILPNRLVTPHMIDSVCKLHTIHIANAETSVHVANGNILATFKPTNNLKLPQHKVEQLRQCPEKQRGEQ